MELRVFSISMRVSSGAIDITEIVHRGIQVRKKENEEQDVGKSTMGLEEQELLEGLETFADCWIT